MLWKDHNIRLIQKIQKEFDTHQDNQFRHYVSSKIDEKAGDDTTEDEELCSPYSKSQNDG